MILRHEVQAECLFQGTPSVYFPLIKVCPEWRVKVLKATVQTPSSHAQLYSSSDNIEGVSPFMTNVPEVEIQLATLNCIQVRLCYICGSSQ